jgi:hypothetical protein
MLSLLLALMPYAATTVPRERRIHAVLDAVDSNANTSPSSENPDDLIQSFLRPGGKVEYIGHNQPERKASNEENRSVYCCRISGGTFVPIYLPYTSCVGAIGS